MRAAQQGAFDGLCGVYSLINALELVRVTGRRSALHRELFIQLTHALGAGALLSAMHEGLEPFELMRAADVGFHWLKTVHGIHLELSQPYETRRFGGVRPYVQALREQAETPDAAVILSFKKPGTSHWSVVRGVRSDAIQLRDSNGLSELPLEGFTLTRGAYQLRPADTLVVQRLDPE